MSTCNCEHWGSCPLGCPERFDENGIRKPPEPSQREKDRKDAERYRWLRDESNQVREDIPCVSDDSFNTFFGVELDAKIDVEIAALKGE